MSWILYALLSAVFAALVAVFGKIGIKNVDSTMATTVRAVIMAAFLVGASAVVGKIKLIPTLNSRALSFIILSGIAGAISWLFYFFALKNGPASGVAALDRLSVVFVLVFAVLFLGEGLSWKSGLGAVLITLGAIFMTLK
ncbi:MAG: EamA family transporter [Parcubacteria group bacterium]|nr:EamA family transporter [Parcubacteria group bacterium]